MGVISAITSSIFVRLRSGSYTNTLHWLTLMRSPTQWFVPQNIGAYTASTSKPNFCPYLVKYPASLRSEKTRPLYVDALKVFAFPTSCAMNQGATNMALFFFKTSACLFPTNFTNTSICCPEKKSMLNSHTYVQLADSVTYLGCNPLLWSCKVKEKLIIQIVLSRPKMQSVREKKYWSTFWKNIKTASNIRLHFKICL